MPETQIVAGDKPLKGLTRRQMLIGMGYSISLVLFGSASALSKADPIKNPAPLLVDASNPSFEVFYQLSQWVTYREELNIDAAKKLFKLFQDEPWGKEHISRTYSGIRDSYANANDDKTTISQILEGEILGEGESWFMSHLLTTWYLGIYYHEAFPAQRVLYEDALMYQVTNNILPIPYSEPIGFGNWTNPPGHSHE